MKPWDEDTTSWKVCSLGREINADWLLIQICFTLSYVFANTILYGFLSDQELLSPLLTYPVSEPHLEYWPISLDPASSLTGMAVA